MTPRKIVIASESFYPVVSGVAVMTERLAHYLAEQGHDVAVITPSRTNRQYTESRRGYTIHRIPSWPNPFRQVHRITLFPNHKVKQVMTRLKPDIVHIHDPWVTSIAVAKYCRLHNIPVIVTHHFSYDFLRAYVRKLKVLHKGMQVTLEKVLFLPLYNSCNILTVPSETMRKGISEIDGLEVVPRVVSNGVNIARFEKPADLRSFYARYGLPTTVPLITCVSRMDPEKNIPLHLEALRLLARKKIPFHALMLGDGADRDELEELANQLGLAKRITWVRRIDNQSNQMVQMYQASAVLCVPSPVETESLITMEAMSASRPIVAANRRALRELVHDGQNGYLVEPDDVSGWAERLEKLLANPALREKMGAASRQKITARDMRKSFQTFENLYAELLSAAKAR